MTRCSFREIFFYFRRFDRLLRFNFYHHYFPTWKKCILTLLVYRYICIWDEYGIVRKFNCKLIKRQSKLWDKMKASSKETEKKIWIDGKRLKRIMITFPVKPTHAINNLVTFLFNIFFTGIQEYMYCRTPCFELFLNRFIFHSYIVCHTYFSKCECEESLARNVLKELFVSQRPDKRQVICKT